VWHARFLEFAQHRPFMVVSAITNRTLGDGMKLAIAIAFLLASSLTAQAGNTKNRTIGHAYGAASTSSNTLASNASYVGARAQANQSPSPYDTYAGGGNVNPWNARTCY
jgi:hypothetical protein